MRCHARNRGPCLLQVCSTLKQLSTVSAARAKQQGLYFSQTSNHRYSTDRDTTHRRRLRDAQVRLATITKGGKAARPVLAIAKAGERLAHDAEELTHQRRKAGVAVSLTLTKEGVAC